MVVSFSTIAGGVWIENLGGMERSGKERCFRFDKDGNAEYATLQSLQADGERARWFGHVYTSKDFTFC